MKLKILLFLMIIFGSSMVLAYTPNKILECEIVDSCQEDYVDLFHLFSTINSHAELSNYSNFDYEVCCKSNYTSINYTCEGNYTTILHLFQETNSHVELSNRSNYDIKVCLSTPSSSHIKTQCGYYGSCPTNFTCLASVNQDTNSHMGDCDAYPIKICCALIDSCLPSEDIIWLVNCSDNCIWEEVINISGNLSLNGTGKIILNTTMNLSKRPSKIYKEDGCIFKIGEDGRIEMFIILMISLAGVKWIKKS